MSLFYKDEKKCCVIMCQKYNECLNVHKYFGLLFDAVSLTKS